MKKMKIVGRGKACERSAEDHGTNFLCIDLIFQILIYLPFCQIYRLRTVCKAWNTLLRSSDFEHAWSAACRAEWAVMVKTLPGPNYLKQPSELVAYDPTADRWMSLEHLLGCCLPTASSALGCPYLGRDLSLYKSKRRCLTPLEASSTSAAGNFVCFWKSNIECMPAHCHILLVCNLLNGSHRIINPPFPVIDVFDLKNEDEWISGQKVSMQLLPHMNAYRVFLYSGAYKPLHIYDSRTGLWETREIHKLICENKIDSAEDINDADLVMLMPMSLCSFYRVQCLSYNMKLNEWKELIFKLNPKYGLETLVRHAGRVFMAAVPYVQTFHRGFAVWELHFLPHPEWVYVASTPPRYWREFYHIGGIPTKTLVDKEGLASALESWKRLDRPDSIPFNSHNSDKTWRIMSSGPLIYLTSTMYDTTKKECNYPPLVYNLVSDSWFQLPCYRLGYNLAAAFSMRPSFVASA